MPDAWGYTKKDGPDTWVNVAPAAAGKCQSPVDVVTSNATFDQKMADRPLVYSYTKKAAESITNNGHTYMVNYNAVDSGSELKGGPLDDKYQITQFHMHWGKTSETGAEHTIDGHQYAAEIHLVHWNSDKFDALNLAVAERPGLAVLCIFVKVGDNPHAGFGKLMESIPQIPYHDDNAPLKEGFDTASLLPGNTREYWTYPGSLTTPPCLESVQFIIFKEPIEVTEEQLAVVRRMKVHNPGDKCEDEFGGCIVENYRPCQPLNDRSIRVSFQ